MLLSETLGGNRKFLATVRDIKITNLVVPRSRNSIILFNLRQRGCTKVGQLSLVDLAMLRPLLENKDLTKLNECLMHGVGNEKLSAWEVYYENKLLNLVKASSRDIRNARADKEPICVYKIGAIMTPLEASNWGQNLKKLSCVRHRNTLLRVAHGEIYSKDKLLRYGLTEDNTCPRCLETEDLHHKLIDCAYVKRIWTRFRELTGERENADIENFILGAYKNCDSTKLTLHAEILGRILGLKENESYLLHPKAFVKNAIMYLRKKEKKNEIKTELEALLR